MAPHTWSAIQKPVITQTMAVVAPTTNESMHIFKSFLRLIFNLLLSPCITPCITVPALGNHPLRQRPNVPTAQRSNGPTFHLHRPIAERKISAMSGRETSLLFRCFARATFSYGEERGIRNRSQFGCLVHGHTDTSELLLFRSGRTALPGR